MKIQAMVHGAQRTLQGVSDAPQLDAERIALQVVQQTEASWLHAHGEENLTAAQAKEFERLVAERASGKPLAYVLGEWEFYGRPFYVNENVLVPRPETEALVSAALAYINALLQKQERVVVADVGTGSGVIAVTLLCEALRKGEALDKVYATDISPAALAVATKNARRHGVEKRIEFLQGDMLDPLRDKQVDLVVSNPPYVPTAELSPHFAPPAGEASRGKLATQGLKFEPRIALDGGPDGQKYLQIIRDSGIPALVEGTGGEILRFNL